MKTNELSCCKTKTYCYTVKEHCNVHHDYLSCLRIYTKETWSENHQLKYPPICACHQCVWNGNFDVNHQSIECSSIWHEDALLNFFNSPTINNHEKECNWVCKNSSHSNPNNTKVMILCQEIQPERMKTYWDKLTDQWHTSEATWIQKPSLQVAHCIHEETRQVRCHVYLHLFNYFFCLT